MLEAHHLEFFLIELQTNSLKEHLLEDNMSTLNICLEYEHLRIYALNLL